jgi:hypothetical protein
MLPWNYSIRRVHHRSSHEYLRVVTVGGGGMAKPWSQPPIDKISFHILSSCMFKCRRPLGKCLLYILLVSSFSLV